ncbi:MAG: ferritin family protein [Deltaproteobacteria bacterium]|nr:ferritin family protein [Deltaproteobacteria bacterium]
MEREDVCYTRETALQKAIEMESKSFETYKDAYGKVKDPRAKRVVKELALDELEHRYLLEKAFFEETIALHDADLKEGPSMNLSIILEERPLDADSTDQDVMIHAIHEEKRAIEFYKSMARECGDAPMEGMFKKLHQDEERHLASLEELYESIYMQEM